MPADENESTGAKRTIASRRGRDHGQAKLRAAGPSCSGSPVRLGPTTGPRRTVASIRAGVVQQVFSILFSLNAFVLFWAVRSVLAGRHSLPVSFHAGGVTPSLTFRSGTAFAGVNPSKPREGVTPPARKKRGPGSARAARGGVLSRPDERIRVKTKERPKKFVLWTKINNFVAKQKLNLL